MPNVGLAACRDLRYVARVGGATADVSRQHAALSRALQRLAVGGVCVGHCRIEPHHEMALLPCEAAAFGAAVPLVRRRSGAARQLARRLMAGHGVGCDVAIPRGVGGAPKWPAGVVGSLAHDDDFAVAAIASSDNVRGLGIDIEPAEPLPVGLDARVARPDELRSVGDDVLAGRVLFVAKEAVFKATFPCDGVFLDFADIEIDLAAKSATTATGHVLRVDVVVAGRVVALARW